MSPHRPVGSTAAFLLTALSVACAPADLDVTVRLETEPELQLNATLSSTNGTIRAPSFEWYLQDEPRPEFTGPTVPGNVLIYGQEWRVVATAGDGKKRLSASDSIALAAAPTLAATIVPADPFTQDDLTAVLLVTDGFFDDPKYRAAWTVDDVPRPEFDDTLIIPADATTRGEVWTITITAVDPWSASQPTASVTIANSPPEIAWINIRPKDPTTNRSLTAEHFTTDGDDDTLTERWTWWVNEVEVTDGADGPRLDAAVFVRDDVIRYRLDITDGVDTDTRERTVVVQNALPTAPVVAITPAPAATGDALRCRILTPSTDDDDDPITLAFQWTVDGVPWTGPTTSAAHPGDGIPADVVNGGETWTCTVTPSDPRGNGTNGVATALIRYRYAAFAAAAETTCGLRTDGTLRCTGSAAFALNAPPPGTFVALHGGSSYFCALDARGIASCWGRDTSGETAPPAEPLRDLALGLHHGCGLDAIDEAICWGDNRLGQATPLPGPWRALAAGDFHTCGIRADDGTIACWGWDAYGQASPPPGEAQQLTAGAYHTCALTPSGELRCFGWDAAGADAAPTGAFTTLAAGDFHTCATREGVNGSETICWPPLPSTLPAIPAPLNLPLLALDGGGAHHCGLTPSDVVVCWGANDLGQCTPL